MPLGHWLPFKSVVDVLSCHCSVFMPDVLLTCPVVPQQVRVQPLRHTWSPQPAPQYHVHTCTIAFAFLCAFRWISSAAVEVHGRVNSGSSARHGQDFQERGSLKGKPVSNDMCDHEEQYGPDRHGRVSKNSAARRHILSCAVVALKRAWSQVF